VYSFDIGIITTVKPLGARSRCKYSLGLISKEYIYSKPVGSCWCQTYSNAESTSEAHITMSLYVWKAIFQIQILFLGQGLNKMQFFGYIMLHMMTRQPDQNATWSSLENAISMSSVKFICDMTSPVVVLKNSILWDCFDFVATIFPDHENAANCGISASA